MGLWHVRFPKFRNKRIGRVLQIYSFIIIVDIEQTALSKEAWRLILMRVQHNITYPCQYRNKYQTTRNHVSFAYRKSC